MTDNVSRVPDAEPMSPAGTAGATPAPTELTHRDVIRWVRVMGATPYAAGLRGLRASDSVQTFDDVLLSLEQLRPRLEDAARRADRLEEELDTLRGQRTAIRRFLGIEATP